MRRLLVRTPRDPSEAEAFGWLVVHGLAPLAQPTSSDVEALLERTGAGRMRVAIRSGQVVGGLVLLDMGQFFGGRAVPMTGVSAVVVAPEHRGQGIGSALLRAALGELAGRRVGLASLFPATVPPYRKLGWELAGARSEWRLPTRAFGRADRRLEVRPLRPRDRAALHALHHAWASRRNGMLERIDWTWRRVLESPHAEVRAHVVEASGGGLAGCVVATREPRGGGHDTELIVRDLVAAEPGALLRLLTFLGDHASVASTARLVLGPSDPIETLVADAPRELVAERPWMTRVVDVAAAMHARGFAPGLSCEIDVEIDDPELPANAGRFTLSCRAGRGSARRGRRRPEVALHARGLAAAFTGHLPGEALAVAGLGSGSAAALERLTAMFAGSAPWTSDTW